MPWHVEYYIYLFSLFVVILKIISYLQSIIYIQLSAIVLESFFLIDRWSVIFLKEFYGYYSR